MVDFIVIRSTFQGRPTRADFSELKPGDILLCHNHNGGYGYWTHAVLYLGDNRVLDANDFVKGTEIRRVEEYRNYDEVEALRAHIGEDTRKQIVQCALEEKDKPYDPFGGLNDQRSEYCSKLVWRVYSRQGIVLCSPNAWVVPDDLSKSTQLSQIAHWTSNTEIG